MSVYQKINLVQAELAEIGIAKSHTNNQQGYNFRGIDDVYAALSPLLAKHGLCILPRMTNRTVAEKQTQRGGLLFYVTVTAEFDFVSVEDGSKHTVITFGEAMDSGDKATNKAMSAAYKYAAFQAFAIPTEGDNDADAKSHKPRIVTKPIDGAIDEVSEQERRYLEEMAVDLIADVAKGMAQAAVNRIENENLTNEQKLALWSLLDSKTRSAIKKQQKG